MKRLLVLACLVLAASCKGVVPDASEFHASFDVGKDLDVADAKDAAAGTDVHGELPLDAEGGDGFDNADQKVAVDVADGGPGDMAADAQPDALKDAAVDTQPDVLIDPCAGKNCDDGNPCTTDSCSQANGCTHAKFTGTCSDGNACTSGDSCTSGTCNGVAVTCDDSNPCTADSCNVATGCVNANVSGSCSDGNACTKGDTCQNGTCTGTTISCADAFPCTSDTCNTSIGCVHTAVSSACDDSIACTTDSCSTSTGCIYVPVNAACDDGNICTTDSCDASGCQHGPNTGACDDLNACTTGDQCKSGACQAGTLSCAVTETNCADGVDNDKDGQPDCVDADCLASPACQCKPDIGLSCGISDAWSNNSASSTAVITSYTCADGGGSLVNETGNEYVYDFTPECDGPIAVTLSKTATSTGFLDLFILDSSKPCLGSNCVAHALMGAGTATAKFNSKVGQHYSLVVEGYSGYAGTFTIKTSCPCDDGNPCTADSCTSGNGCSHTNLSDWTVCGEGLICNGAGACADVKTAKGMVYIPAGTFWMGCNATKDTNCNANENPQHRVTLSAYYMDLTETTVGQYKACVDAGVCTVPSTVQPDGAATYPGLTDHPVNFVTWAQSQQYCQWRGAEFDLPTEAQWEMGARGGCEKNGSTAGDPACAEAMRTYPWGEAAPTCSYAVTFDGGKIGCGTNATWVVGSKTAGDSPYGLHDMAGNVIEWIRDGYSSTYYSSSPATDPYNSASASYRVLRGGSFDFVASYLRAGNRYYNPPSYASPGLRCMRPYSTPSLCANVTCPAIACATNTCNPTTGQCLATAKSNGTGCDDGNACTSGDNCTGGACVGVVNCDDGDVCTQDACDAATSACTHKAIATSVSCDDGNACTGNDMCAAGACTGVALSCDDGIACTIDSCNSVGTCVHTTTANCASGTVGCADGTREGFGDLQKFPTIAACGGAWDQPGIFNMPAKCNNKSGNDGVNAAGAGCTVTDLCSPGWHVCYGKDDVVYRNTGGCAGVMTGATGPVFFTTQMSSAGSFNCATGAAATDDLFGCGNLGCDFSANATCKAQCSPLTLSSHDLCKGLRNDLLCGDWCNHLGKYPGAPNSWDCGSDNTKEAFNVVKTHPEQQGGVLCCLD